jgi:hypothetical protein
MATPSPRDGPVEVATPKSVFRVSVEGTVNGVSTALGKTTPGAMASAEPASADQPATRKRPSYMADIGHTRTPKTAERVGEDSERVKVLGSLNAQ